MKKTEPRFNRSKPHRAHRGARAISALALVLYPARAHAEDSDPWWGPDKARHFGVSAVIAAGTYGASSLALESRWQRAATGAGVALTLGAGKEYYDSLGHGTPSWKDFTWDVIGAAVGVGAALALDLALSPRHKSEQPAASGLVLRF